MGFELMFIARCGDSLLFMPLKVPLLSGDLVPDLRPESRAVLLFTVTSSVYLGLDGGIVFFPVALSPVRTKFCNEVIRVLEVTSPPYVARLRLEFGLVEPTPT